MFCNPQRLRNLIPVILVFTVLVLLVGLSGCGTLEQQYAGYKVIDKEIKTESKKVPIRVTACVTPQGYVICERRYGAFNDCSLSCKTPQNTWVERPEGYGGYEEKKFNQYFLTMQSPSGKVEKSETSEGRFNQVTVGQIIGEAANKLGDPNAQKGPARRNPDVGNVPVPIEQAPSSSPSVRRDTPAATVMLSIADAQRRLSALGFDAGPPDGFMGPQTSRALQAFQKARNISITSQLDDATVRELLR